MCLHLLGNDALLTESVCFMIVQPEIAKFFYQILSVDKGGKDSLQHNVEFDMSVDHWYRKTSYKDTPGPCHLSIYTPLHYDGVRV